MPAVHLRHSLAAVAGLALAISMAPTSASEQAANEAKTGWPADAYFGNYHASGTRGIGIDRFIDDAGDHLVLYSDYASGVVRRAFPVSDAEFEVGPGFQTPSPPEVRLHFVKSARDQITGVVRQSGNESQTLLARVPITEEPVTVSNGDVKLSGTLLLPSTKGPHPAIILLHGSGPLTRYSFGPYPHFFTSLGLAVLIYDKRGTGGSTGTAVGLSGEAQTPQPADHYPDQLNDDALAMFRYLRTRREINPSEIGFWGSSEGGMLATQAAAREPAVAFAIDSSGFMGPLWETLVYQSTTYMKGLKASPAQIAEARDFAQRWVRVARTGQGYEELMKKADEARRAGKPWLNFWKDRSLNSLEQMRWNWDHIASFSPLPALSRVTCPVLGLWGELDDSTDARAAAHNLSATLTQSGNRDVTVKVFPNANHPLIEMPAGNRMAPGVFETLRSWLLARVHVADS